MDRAIAARAIEEFLRALGHAPEGPLANTPALVADAWCDELLAGYADDPVRSLAEGAIATTATTGLVALRGLDVAMMCPHHLLPAHGSADVVYLPKASVAGFGAIARAVFLATRRLVLQEDAGADIARTIVQALDASGALCRMRLTHTCFSTRGACHPRATIDTIAFAGSFATQGPDHDAALALLCTALPHGSRSEVAT